MKRVFLFIDRNINWFLTIFCIVFCLTMFHQTMYFGHATPLWISALFSDISYCIVQKTIGAICFVAMIVFTVLCVRGILNDDRWLIAFISIALIQVIQCVYACIQTRLNIYYDPYFNFAIMFCTFFPPFLGLLSCLIFYSGYGLYRLSLRLPPRQHRESKQDQIDRLNKQVEWLQLKIDEEKNKTE